MANEKSNKEYFQEQVQKPLQDILKDKKTFISSGTLFLGNMYGLFVKPIDWFKDFLASDWIYYIFLFISMDDYFANSMEICYMPEII
jgi:hypothetical protein